MCICTYKRPDGLRRLLEALNGQVFPVAPPPSICIIVVDNSPTADAAETCKTRKWNWPLHYLHEPSPGIPQARNTAIAAVPGGTDFIAMIDDDEVPAPNWLDSLLNAQERSGADIIAGPVTPIFPPGIPSWIPETSFFLTPRNQAALHDLHPNPPTATGNVLMRASIFSAEGITFDPALCLSGGSDKLLFQDLKRRGYTFAWAPTALAEEVTPAERANLTYMLRSAYRRGWVKYYVKRRLKSRSAMRSIWIAMRLMARSVWRIVYHFLYMLLHFARGPKVWAPHALNLADHLGIIAGIMRMPNKHYQHQKS